VTSAAVTVTRTLKAQPHQVFSAWTRAESLREWFFPAPGFVTEASCDPVVGGRYRVVGVLPDGVDEITGEYLEIDPPRRLVFTFESGHSGDQVTRVTVTFDASGGGEATDMTIRHENLPETDFRLAVPDGWAGVLDNLELFLSR
jgi:uncharacterized protein YndB with AHSA1/START domain